MIKKFRLCLLISIFFLHSSLPSVAMDFIIQDELRSLQHAVSSHKHIPSYGYSNATEDSCVICRPKTDRIRVLQRKTDSFMTIAEEEAKLRRRLLEVEVRRAEEREREENQRRREETQRIKAETKETNTPLADVLTTTQLQQIIIPTIGIQSASNVPKQKRINKVAPVEPESNTTIPKRTGKSGKTKMKNHHRR